jgi:anti-anti-sigma factor
MKADILISQNQGVYRIMVKGRATYESSPPIRNLAKSIGDETVRKVAVNLQECTGMDSTFMGVLAMLALETRKKSVTLDIVNASASNRNLIQSLGLQKLFTFSDGEFQPSGAGETGLSAGVDRQWKPMESRADILETAETVLDAHDTLHDVDPANIPRFEKVIEFAKRDVCRLREKAKKSDDEGGTP